MLDTVLMVLVLAFAFSTLATSIGWLLTARRVAGLRRALVASDARWTLAKKNVAERNMAAETPSDRKIRADRMLDP